jgi:phage-related tail fiber protein
MSTRITGNSSSSLLPAGSVIYFAGPDAPIGFLIADGRTLSRTAYADLFNNIGTWHGAGDGTTTFRIPDLRGEFIRGIDNTRGIDVNRAFASEQLDQFETHKHNISGQSGVLNDVVAFADSNTDGAHLGTWGGWGWGWAGWQTSGPRGDTYVYVQGPNSGKAGSETRPRNIALLPCIKI